MGVNYNTEGARPTSPDWKPQGPVVKTPKFTGQPPLTDLSGGQPVLNIEANATTQHASSLDAFADPADQPSPDADLLPLATRPREITVVSAQPQTLHIEEPKILNQPSGSLPFYLTDELTIKPPMAFLDDNPLDTNRQPEKTGKVPDDLPQIYRDFYQGILSGEVVSPTKEQIEIAVDEYFLDTPLTELTAEQEEVLRQLMLKRHNNDFNGPYSKRKWDSLAGERSFYHPGIMLGNLPVPHLFCIPDGDVFKDFAEDMFREHQPKPISREEKAKILTDPGIYTNLQLVINGIRSPMLGNGTRHLIDELAPNIRGEYFDDGLVRHDSYGFNHKRFLEVMDKIQAAQNKNPKEIAKGLDIGGSNGVAAYDAERFAANLEMTNITIDPEIGIWPLRGGHRFLFGERLPCDFAGKFDLILSNTAFRYMGYPDIALENAIHALKVGGILQIGFSSDYGKLYTKNPDQLDKAINDKMLWLEELERTGKIQTLPLPPTLRNLQQDWKEYRKDIAGYLHLQKTGSF